MSVLRRFVVVVLVVLCCATGASAATSLTSSKAGAIAAAALTKRYGAEFSGRQGYRSACSRVTSTQYRCAVSWKTASAAYAGTVTVRGATASIAVTRKTVAPKPTASNCDPNYKGACLDPNASDYDCQGGSGNGPKYTGTVTVVGSDPFDLDRDGDGIACAS